ncbi:NmrA family NAD(P)-binding protein [Streptomyces sp. NPDC001435]|uniref:NmrA family NAD(P)-binding protein n=1 Tax=unclassified Streptomyces TaxID=2593676 RepID=UPI0036BD867A
MTAQPRMLVTAAAGSTGRQTVLALLEQGFPVHALVRRDDARAQDLRGRGADVIVGSLTDMHTLRAALTGVQRAYFVTPFMPGALDAAVLFAAAAEEQRLEAVVSMSQWLADPQHPSLHTRRSWMADQVFSWMPTVGAVTVNPGFFADNYMAALEPIAQFGLMTMPLGEGRNAPPSNEDIARMVAALLADPGPHLGRTYRPTGPRLLSPQDIADTFGRVLGRRVVYRDAPAWMLAKVAKSLGYSDFDMAQLRWYIDEYRRDAFAVGAPDDAVLRLTGSPAEDFETTVRRYIDASPDTRLTLASRPRALARLLRAMMAPAPDYRRYERTHDDQPSAHATLAADSTAWRDAHDPAARTRTSGEPERAAR